MIHAARLFLSLRDEPVKFRLTPAPTEERGVVEDATDRFANCSKNTPCTPHGCEAGGGKWLRCPTPAPSDPLPTTEFRREDAVVCERFHWENVRNNTLNPAHTMTFRGLEAAVDACHEIALRVLAAPDPAIAHGEMAERLRVAEARVAVLERAASWALGEGDSDFPGPYAGYGAIGWRVKFRALLEGAQP